MNENNRIEELIKDTYADFGLAYYFSECLHRQLCIMLAYSGFSSKRDITSPRVEEKMTEAFSLTLGQVVEKVRESIPKELQTELDLALEKRNFLAHHFWFENAHLMLSEDGLIKMREELSKYSSLFQDLDNKLEQYFLPIMKSFGISDEILQQSLHMILMGQRFDPLPKQRRLKKKENIVRIWNASHDKGKFIPIFETDDGALWQLCDVGLGWTHYTEPEDNWKVNATLQKYLPTTVDPRPPSKKPWSFEFMLGKGSMFWIDRDDKTGKLKWGIKTKK